MAEVHLISTIFPVAGKEKQVREILCRTVQHITQEEKSCFTFLLTETITPSNRVEFKVIERWSTSEDLTQHQSRDWLRQMYAEFEDQHLLEVEEDIQHLEFIAGFASR